MTRQGFKSGGSRNRDEIPEEVKCGYDYDDPALWHPFQSQFFVWKTSFEKYGNQRLIDKFFSYFKC